MRYWHSEPLKCVYSYASVGDYQVQPTADFGQAIENVNNEPEEHIVGLEKSILPTIQVRRAGRAIIEGVKSKMYQRTQYIWQSTVAGIPRPKRKSANHL
jgi:hypothetical protein